MDLFEAIETRNSARKFKDEIPPMEDILKILDAARRAPSSTNSQMWHYVVITNPEVKEQMREAIIETYEEMQTWEEAQDKYAALEHYKKYSSFFTSAPVNIAVLMEPEGSEILKILKKRGLTDEEINRKRPSPELLSVGASVENLSLAAHAMGYGTCWLTAPLYAVDKLEQIIGVKEPYQLVSILCMGTPLVSKLKQRKKKDISEIYTVID
ncbi:MAG: nitroreductase family protein [bacterium]